jgi:phospholipase/carboxylesterase
MRIPQLMARVLLPGLAWLVLGAGAAPPGKSDRLQAYETAWQNAQHAYALKDYRRAATWYKKVRDLLPFEPSCRYQLACCHALLGDADKALNALDAAIAHGWDDPDELERADDVKSLRGQARFPELVKKAAACREETVVVYAGKDVDPDRPAPVLVLLHGLGAGPRSEVPLWQTVADRLGLVVIAPRGVTRVGPRLTYGWHKRGAKKADELDLAAAAKRIDEGLALAKKRYRIDPERILLAGFSQGGGVALRLLADHPERYAGALAVCARYQPRDATAWRAAARRSRRVAVLAGQLDPLLPHSRKAVAELRAAGVKTHYVEVERAGHEPPPDYPEQQRRAVAFLLPSLVQNPER